MRKDVREIVQENMYMTIATITRKNTPWITPVFFAYNNNLDLYWYSPKDSLHSRNIEENEEVAITIFNSTATGNDIKALYIKAKAKELATRDEIKEGLIPYAMKMAKTQLLNPQSIPSFLKKIRDFRGKSPLRMYKAIPYEISLLAESTMYKDLYIDSRDVI